MQNQLEICKLEGDRKITLDVTTKWLSGVKKVILKDKKERAHSTIKEGGANAQKKAFLLYVQSSITRGVVDESIKRKETESDHIMGKKSYIQKTRELLLELR